MRENEIMMVRPPMGMCPNTRSSRHSRALLSDYQSSLIQKRFKQACQNENLTDIKEILSIHHVNSDIDIGNCIHEGLRWTFTNNKLELGVYILKQIANIREINYELFRSKISNYCITGANLAIKCGEYELAIELLTKKIFANTAFANIIHWPNASLLEIAFSIAPSKKSTQFLEYILRNNDININTNIKGKNILIFALKNHACNEEIKLLIWHGANVNAVYKNNTVLMHAIKLFRFDIAKTLIHAGADVNAVNLYNFTTPLTCACDSKNKSFVEDLLDNDANLHIDTSSIPDEILQTLKHGVGSANPTHSQSFFSKNAQQLFHFSQRYTQILVFCAIKNSNFVLFKKALLAGNLQDISTLRNYRDSEGRNMLMLACMQPDKRFIDYILKYLYPSGLDFIPNVDDLGQTTLMYACKYQQQSLIQYILIHYNNGINCTDDNGMTALMKLCKNISPENEASALSIVKLLLDKGADWTMRDNNGKNAQHHAKDNVNLINLFYEYPPLDEHIVVNNSGKSCSIL